MNTKQWLICAVLAASVFCAADSLLSGKWHNNAPKQTTVNVENETVCIRVDGTLPLHGSWQRSIQLPKNRDYVFSADVSGDQPNIAYLSVKLFRNKKEIARFSSRRNETFKRNLAVPFSTKDADKVQLLLRTILQPEFAGGKAFFRNLKLEEKKPAPPPAPAARLEIVPGYEVCSFYLNRLNANAENQFRCRVSYRKKGTAGWLPALDPVFIPPEKAARGSIVKLQENTEYELKLEISDAGKNETEIVPFRTKTPDVPVARTVVLNKNNFKGHLVIQDEGSPAGYIRYTAAPGFVLRGIPGKQEVILLDQAKYVILDGLTIRGNDNMHALHVAGGNHLQIVNCDIAGYSLTGTHRPELDGKYFNEKNRPLNYHSGIRIRHAADVLVERNYIHDPKAPTNPWFYSHPAGPNAVFVEHAAALAMRYNDFIGNDLTRWNDAVEGGGNGHEWGGFFRDGEIKGNYFVLANDDGIELDGGQMNARMFQNKIEYTFCGVSTAACMKGPSYIFENLFVNPGDVFDRSNAALKNNLGNRLCGVGRIFYFNNTAAGRFVGASQFNASGKEGTKAVFINNVFALPGRSLFYDAVFRDPLYFSNNMLYGRALPQEAFYKNARHGKPSILTEARFTAPERGNFSLKAGTAGIGASEEIPNFQTKGSDLGAPAELPYRPLGFHTDKSALQFNGQKLTDTVTVSANQNWKGCFRVMKNDATDYLSVNPSNGVLNPGASVVLTVTVDPSKLKLAKEHKAVFLIRAENGLSRPVSFTMDNSRDATLAKQARQNVIYASSISKQNNGRQTIEFKVPRTGRYYLFAFTSGSTYAVNASFNGSPMTKAVFFSPGMSRPGKSWKGLHPAQSPNRPFGLKQGETFRIDVEQRANFKYSIYNAALAATPEELLFAPEVE